MDGDDDSAMLPPAGAESVEGVALAAAAIIAMVALVLGVRYALRWWSSSPAAEDMVVLKGTADDADADADEDADADATVPVIVQWCGGCGFQDRFEQTFKLLEARYPTGVTVVSRRDNGVTGNFEVFVNGRLIHSLKTRRQGFPHNNSERMDAIFEAIDHEVQLNKKKL